MHTVSAEAKSEEVISISLLLPGMTVLDNDLFPAFIEPASPALMLDASYSNVCLDITCFVCICVSVLVLIVSRLQKCLHRSRCRWGDRLRGSKEPGFCLGYIWAPPAKCYWTILAQRWCGLLFLLYSYYCNLLFWRCVYWARSHSCFNVYVVQYQLDSVTQYSL